VPAGLCRRRTTRTTRTKLTTLAGVDLFAPARTAITGHYPTREPRERARAPLRAPVPRPFPFPPPIGMAKNTKAKKFAAVKRMLAPKDPRLAPARAALHAAEAAAAAPPRNAAAAPSTMFFAYNTALGPPYRILLDTNFINFAIKNKLEIVRAAMDCLLAKCIPVVTDCVMAELEKLGSKYRVALRVAKDPRFERLTCAHAGTYADDCLVNRVREHRCYIVATCDKDLRRRIRKVPGVPCLYITQRKFQIERMPEAFGAPK
jgi:U3 small nucleolar RNA-associated protein 24